MDRKPQFRSDGVKHATINGHRFHLRLKDPIADNFLWIDGLQPPLVLDAVAAEFVSHLIDAMWLYQTGEGDNSDQVMDYVVGKMYSKYGRLLSLPKYLVTRSRIKADLNRIFGTLMCIAEGACPAEQTLGPKEIKYADWIAPARMDLAVTYRCNLECGKCYVGDKNIKELSTAEWVKVFEILWSIGIPQVVFTGGEPTLREDIVQLIAEADEFVTGLVTNGTTLDKLAKPLKEASLDYVQITIESHDAKVHDTMTGVRGSFAKTLSGIKTSLQEGLQVVTNTTLTRANGFQFNDTLTFLHSIGVKNAACNTLICSGRGTACRQQDGLTDTELHSILQSACEAANKLEMSFQWYSPTCYTLGVNPMDLGFGIKACSAAAHNMTIQPDGSVLPCQSWQETVGNILTDEWKSIWENPVCVKLRENLLKPKECAGCEFEEPCAGGCPLDPSPRKKQV